MSERTRALIDAAKALQTLADEYTGPERVRALYRACAADGARAILALDPAATSALPDVDGMVKAFEAYENALAIAQSQYHNYEDWSAEQWTLINEAKQAFSAASGKHVSA